MPRRVEYTRFGGPEILELVEVARPEPGPGQIRVHVRSAGLNPIDWKIFTGRAAAAYGVEPPSGNGNDFAGEVDALGAGVTGLEVGALVFGGARNDAQADYLVIDAANVLPVPDGLTLDQAGSLDIAARTAAAAVAAVGVASGDIVLVSAAAGGVGVIASQLAVRAGATVVGTASESNHEFLRSIGVIPVAYGDGLIDRLRDAAPGPFTAALDNHGRASIDAALGLGVATARVNTIADRPAAAELGLSAVGGAAASLAELTEVAALIASGDLVLPIDSVYPLERVRDAYEHLMAGHLRGKVVLVTA
jgi:NADPH:quinone reductase-like Zn-dependent oxidoreductase